jgi:anti-sigma B factor antagonist
MSVKINVRRTDNATILTVTGRITLGASGPSIQGCVREVFNTGHRNIIIDLAGVTYLDSSGLGQLVGSYATAVSQGSEIKLLNLNKRVYDLMQTTKLYTVFQIYTDEATAAQSFELTAVPA